MAGKGKAESGMFHSAASGVTESGKVIIMNYVKLLQLSGRKEPAPSLKPLKWSRDEKECMDKGICVACGLSPSGRTSYLCPACESRVTCDEIQAEIGAARQKMKLPSDIKAVE